MTMDRVLGFVIALAALALAARAIRTGRIRFGLRGKLFGPWIFRRESRPIAFWLAVTFDIAVAVFLGVFAFRGIR